MAETVYIILVVLVIVVLSLVFLKIHRAEKEKKRKEQKKREEAKKLSLEKHKDIYEKAIKEIEGRILDTSNDSVRYDCRKIPMFVAEAIAEYLEHKHWNVYLSNSSITIYFPKHKDY